MPFDGTDATLTHLESQAPLVLVDFVGQLFRLVPGLRLAVEGPDHAGAWWIELTLGALAPAVEWRQDSGFGLYGPGPTLPERPGAVLACPMAAAGRLQRMLQSWQRQPAPKAPRRR